MSVVGRIFTHRMIGVLGWEDVQLPIGLSAALTYCLGKQEIMLAHGVSFTGAHRRRPETYQCNEIDDGQSNQNTDQHQQGNAPAWHARPGLGRGRELHLIH